jgi:hypothetical protein
VTADSTAGYNLDKTVVTLQISVLTCACERLLREEDEPEE